MYAGIFAALSVALEHVARESDPCLADGLILLVNWPVAQTGVKVGDHVKALPADPV